MFTASFVVCLDFAVFPNCSPLLQMSQIESTWAEQIDKQSAQPWRPSSLAMELHFSTTNFDLAWTHHLSPVHHRHSGRKDSCSSLKLSGSSTFHGPQQNSTLKAMSSRFSLSSHSQHLLSTREGPALPLVGGLLSVLSVLHGPKAWAPHHRGSDCW